MHDDEPALDKLPRLALAFGHPSYLAVPLRGARVAQATEGRIVEGPWIDPQERALRVLLRQLPNLLRTGLLAQLQLTVDQYVALITPTEKERNAKRELFNAFAEFLRTTLHDRIAISVAGSTAYEVDARGSDLDVVLLTNWGAPLWVLQHIVQYLRITQVMNVGQNKQQWLLRNSRVQLVESARVPVLSLTTPKGLLCDISVNTLNSVRHTEYFKRVIGLNPILRPLMRMLKFWAKVRRLPIMREGGLPGIVWMVLAVYFGTCPLQEFVRLANAAPAPAAGQVDLTIPPLNQIGVEFLENCDGFVPLFSALFRFFRLCGSRQTMTRSISIASASCVGKPEEEVAARVAASHGVWDEVVSVEDPAVVTETVTGGKVVWNNDGFAFPPGSTTDLAAKISASTWLVYAFELKRGCLILSRLLSFVVDAFRKVATLPVHLADATSAEPPPPPVNGGYQTAHEYIAHHFRSHLAFLFQESVSDRFMIPGCDERLRQLETERRVARAGRPFCECCSSPRHDFAVVLLHGRVHLLRLTSICADWSSWWTREFLSRRDVRSTLHGVLHHLVRPEEYVGVIGGDEASLAQFYHEQLPPTEWPSAGAREPGREGQTAFPSLLLPVRKLDDSSPVDVLFNPCNFVCRIRGWRASGTAATAHDAVLADDVFFLDPGEVAYLDCLAQLAAEAPWHKFCSPEFQPAVPSCPRCHVVGEELDRLADRAGYQVSQGVFQETLYLQAADAIRVAWARWVDHVRLSGQRHRLAEPPGPPTEPAFAPELTRATALLTATIENFQRRSKAAQRVRRTMSVPDLAAEDDWPQLPPKATPKPARKRTKPRATGKR